MAPSRMVGDGVEAGPAVLMSLPMGTMFRQPMLLTKRRAVDLCRVATCLCRFV